MSDLKKLLLEFEDFINEPPEYEDLRYVRDYRHEAARKWTPVCHATLALVAERDALRKLLAPARDEIEGAADSLKESGYFNRATEMQSLADRLTAALSPDASQREAV